MERHCWVLPEAWGEAYKNEGLVCLWGKKKMCQYNENGVTFVISVAV